MGNRAELLREVSLFRDLRPQQLEELERVSSERVYPKDATIFDEGDPGDALFLIVSGAVKILRRSESGREKTLTILGPGDCLGEVALIDGGTRSADALTLTETRVVTIPRAAFWQVLRRYPAIGEVLLTLLARRLRIANNQVEQLAFWDARGRVAATLLALSEVYGSGSHEQRIDLRLTHQELANLAGTTRETSTRILSELCELGYVALADRHLVIRDPQGLRELLSR